MKPLRAAGAWIRRSWDARDLVGATGLALLWYGGEQLYPGVGFTAVGAVLTAIAVLVR